MIIFEEITNKNIWKVCALEPFGEAKKVWLSYEPENTRARDIYQKYGFVENGEMCGNEIVAVYEL